MQSIATSLGVALVYAAAVTPVNLVWGANYLYLSARPVQASPLDYFGPWPWYLPGLAALARVACLIVYVPFACLHAYARLRGR